MDDLLSAPSAELPDLLRAAREAAGLTRNELAGDLAVSWETIRQAEEGRDPRHSTIASYLAALPFLSPRAVLLGDVTAPPLASRAIWDFHQRHFGFFAGRLAHEIRIEEDGDRAHQVDVRGARWSPARGHDSLGQADLMRTVFLGAGPVLRNLHAEPSDVDAGRRIIEDGDTLHEFRFPRRSSEGLHYRWMRRRPGSELEPALQCELHPTARAAEAVAVDVSYPVRILELSVQAAADSPPLAVAFFAAPDRSVPPRGAIALARALHPAGVALRWDRARRIAKVIVTRPLPNLRYGLAWVVAEGAPAGFVPLGDVPVGKTLRLGALSPRGSVRPKLADQLRAARESAGLSARELARRMEASVATVLSIERGDDPRASTLRRALAALPDLLPEDLFADSRGNGPRAGITSDEVWLYYRNVVGLQATEATRTLTLTARGDGSEVIGTRGLVRLHEAPRDVIVKDGIARGVHGRVGPVYLEQRGRERGEELRVRWTRSPGEAPEFQLHIPAALAGLGVSFERRDRKELAYKMKREESDRSIGPAYECFVPLRQLTLVVRFPRGYWPEAIGAFVRAGVNVTNPRWPDLAQALHAGQFRLESTPPMSGRVGCVSLHVERPLLGFRYSVTWRAP